MRLSLEHRLLLLRFRRPLAALFAALSVLLAITAAHGPAPPERLVIVATRDLAAGVHLAAGDVAVRRRPLATLPSAALTAANAAVGRVLAAPVSRGEVLTDRRLVGGGLLQTVTSGQRAVPVRLSDSATAGLLSVGTRVDVFSVPNAADPNAAGTRAPSRLRPTLVASRALVLAPAAKPSVAPFSAAASDGLDSAVVVLAVPAADAADLAAASVAERLVVVLRPD